MATGARDGEADELLAQARALAGGDLAAEARLLTAEAFNGDDADPVTAELAERAIALARRAGDPLTESAALDQLTAVQLARGEIRGALASALRRTELLAPMPVTARSGLELSDALCMATECAIAAGDLRVGPAAGRTGPGPAVPPRGGPPGHRPADRRRPPWRATGTRRSRWPSGSARDGSGPGGRAPGTSAAAPTPRRPCTACAGTTTPRTAWLDIVDALATPGRPLSAMHFGEFFDALLLLHQGRAAAAMELLSTPPEQFRDWDNGMWRPWYAALWAEAAVLTGHPDAAEPDPPRPPGHAWTTRSPPPSWTGPRPWPGTRRDRAGLAPAAAALAAAGCRYQWARTLVVIGGAERARGEAELAAMGATVMAWPPG